MPTKQNHDKAQPTQTSQQTLDQQPETANIQKPLSFENRPLIIGGLSEQTQIPIQQAGALVPTHMDRVRANSDPSINALIDEGIRERVQLYAKSPGLIDKRIHELDKEWDIDRVLETGASSLGFIGLMLGLLRRRRFLLLPALLLPTLFMHATQGWSPQMHILRRMGLRSRREIEAEKYALKILRGDFGDLDRDVEASVEWALEALRR